jgi:hypothetical protein
VTSSRPARAVHCWTQRSLDGLGGWDPDRHPARFADAFGHLILELYVRLRRRGRDLTIGPEAPDGTEVLVVLLEEIVSYDGRLQPDAAGALAGAARRVPSIVVVRGDLPLAVSAPSFLTTEVMPNRASIVDTARQRWVPVLAQRGLRPRLRRRGSSVRTLACKGFDFNLPSELRDGSLAEAFAPLGVRVRLDCDPTTWPDFRRIDVALCARRHNDAWDDPRHLRKPATKLVNAWVGGAIPLVAPQAAYLELVRPDQDALVVAHVDEIVESVRRLTTDPELVRRLQQGGAARAREFSADRVLDAWEQLFDDDQPAP